MDKLWITLWINCEMIETEIMLVIAGGAVGALLKEILGDNCLQLPSLAQGKLNLGFLGSIIVGAFAGYAIDGGFITAAMAGFSGFSIIQKLIPSTNNIITAGSVSTSQMIRYIAQQEGIDPELAVRVAQCESSLDPAAKNVNVDGSIDRGLFQINTKYHPEITDEQAFDPVTATRFFCKAFKDGNLSWWSASKTCWDK